MKILKHILLLFIAALMLAACNPGIDPITPIEPGPDESAPVITIKYPTDGTQIRVPEAVASLNIQFEVTDDIEIGKVVIKIDGVEITSFSEFRDYRRLVKDYLFNNVTNGSHVLAIIATDLENKTTTKSVNFEKTSPYDPIYDGETFYMPFDGDLMEMISFDYATKVGNPGFSNTSIIEGGKSYSGATDGYLTYPSEGLVGEEFSAVFWYKINSTPDRAGIFTISPAGENRQLGLRLAREANGAQQKFFLNVGNGTAEQWCVPPSFDVTNEWMHIAVSVSASHVALFVNGNVVSEADFGPIDWTGCNVISIASGMPNFGYWNHKSDLSLYDELRMFNKALSKNEIQNIIATETGTLPPYQPKYNGEIFYMPFEDSNTELFSKTDATVVGTPGFGTGKVGKAFTGATDSYLTFPLNGLKNSQFSAVMWCKINSTPDRAGILNVSPAGEDRTKGFRFFREGSATSQRYKLNVGTGAGETWNDGGLVTVNSAEWVHLAFTISGSACAVYINGSLASEVPNSGINWDNCNVLGIGSGAPNFVYWNHKSDLSMFDELRIFNKALSLAEIQAIMNDKN